MLAPLALHADPIFQANGYGHFNCAQAYPRIGFGNELMVNMSGSDGQGNYMTAQMDVGQLAGLPTCTATLPTLGFDANNSSPRNGGGEVGYDGLTYTTGFGGCSSPVSNVRCDITFTSSGSGGEGSIDIALSTWVLTFDSRGDIIYETPPTTVDIGGALNFTSLGVGEQLGYGNLLYPDSYGDFSLGDGTYTDFVPEPAAWGLMISAAPLLFLYMRRQLKANR